VSLMLHALARRKLISMHSLTKPKKEVNRYLQRFTSSV
jgi:hypothetical protein